MTWYNPKSWFAENEEKLNPAQQMISREQGMFINTDANISYNTAFEKLETVNRGVSMIVNGCASLDYDIKDKLQTGVTVGIRQKSLNTLLNHTPNPYQSVQEFRTNIFTDFLLEGNIFIYFDGLYLFHLPASKVQIVTDPSTYVQSYRYNSTIVMKPDEVIHIKDTSSTSIYRGTSRLVSADRNIKILYKMQTFQEQFFDNGAVMGLILTSENTLSQIAKDKTIAGWMSKYSPKNGARKPMILDSGLKPVTNLADNFQEMDFDVSIKTHDTKILKALGVPPILLDGGNNANISPNLRLFYLETIMPIVSKFVSAVERQFGYDIEAVTSTVSALQPEMKDVAAFHTTLVNGGVMTPDEARLALRLPPKGGDANDLRIPANIAGSAANPSLGGKPPKPKPAADDKSLAVGKADEN
jgi:HK97 family phage portal protein